MEISDGSVNALSGCHARISDRDRGRNPRRTAGKSNRRIFQSTGCHAWMVRRRWILRELPRASDPGRRFVLYLDEQRSARYRHVQFGKDPDYWKSRLRAYAFSWAFSEQFEMGPISEASIGQIQRYCCQYGFVDHIITPNLGLAVMVGEDSIDKGVVRRIEDRTSNVGIRIASRIVLNPMQSFANMMSWRYPWHRENRDAPSFYDGQLHEPFMRPEMQIGQFEPLIVPNLEIAATVPSAMQIGGLSCLGGGAVAGVHLTDQWQWSLEVSGCTLAQSLPKNWSGDSLTSLRARNGFCTPPVAGPPMAIFE